MAWVLRGNFNDVCRHSGGGEMQRDVLLPGKGGGGAGSPAAGEKQ